MRFHPHEWAAGPWQTHNPVKVMLQTTMPAPAFTVVPTAHVREGQVYNPPRFQVKRICGFGENPMKAILTGLLAVSFLAGMAAAASGPAENDFKALFAKHWQISKEFTLAVAEAMPAESYDFKPNPEEMSFGELMIHIAKANSDAFADVAGTNALAQPSGTDKKTAIKFLTDSFDKCAKDLAAVTPAQFNRMLDI